MNVQKNSITFRISREMAVAAGVVEPTPKEAAEMEAARARGDQRRRDAWATYDAARPLLAAIHDPVARVVLDLHSSATVEFPKCEGCDMDGCEAERPEWPCRTVRAVAAHYGIELPDGMDLWRRPESHTTAPVSLDRSESDPV